MKTVLVTRPQPDADVLATLLRKKNFNILVDPLFKVDFSPAPPEQKNYQALFATSRNAIRALVACKAVAPFAATPLFVVGEETEAEAHAAGFTDVMSAQGSAASLGELIRNTCVPSKGALLYLAGETRKAILENELSAAGFQTDVWQAYAMHPSPALHEETFAALHRCSVDAVLLFSERAAAHFLRLTEELVSENLTRPLYICLSNQVALILEKESLAAVYPSTPSQSAVIELLIQKIH